MVGAMGELAAALSRLNRAAAKAYGEAEAAQFTDDTHAHYSDALARIDAAEVSIDGDKATVRYADARDHPFDLRRVGGGWKIPMAELSRGADAAALDQRLAELDAQAKIVSELTDEIAAGKHKTADAAREAWRGKIMQNLPMRPPLPSTAPAMRPAG